jgi:hypothetical protein
MWRLAPPRGMARRWRVLPGDVAAPRRRGMSARGRADASPESVRTATGRERHFHLPPIAACRRSRRRHCATATAARQALPGPSRQQPPLGPERGELGLSTVPLPAGRGSAVHPASPDPEGSRWGLSGAARVGAPRRSLPVAVRTSVGAGAPTSTVAPHGATSPGGAAPAASHPPSARQRRHPPPSATVETEVIVR